MFDTILNCVFLLFRVVIEELDIFYDRFLTPEHLASGIISHLETYGRMALVLLKL